MANDEKDEAGEASEARENDAPEKDAPEKGAPEKDAPAKDASAKDAPEAEKSTVGERSAEEHEGERSAAEAHLAKKEATEEAFGASKSGDKLTQDPGHPHGPEAGSHTSHHYKPNRKEYFAIFGVLFVLTVLEVGVAQVPGISKTLMGLALVTLAITKAAFVGLYYMHLKHETRILKLTVAIPLATPAVYALVLIAEAAWRLTRQ